MSSYYISPIARGLGDLIVSFPALEGLISTGVPTTLVLRSRVQEGLASRIPGLAGCIDEVDFDPAQLKKSDKYFNLRDHGLQTEYIWGSPEFSKAYPGYLISDIVEKISNDLGIPNISQSKKIMPLTFEIVEEAKGKVIFIPGSAGSMKCWPAKYWLELAKNLEKQNLEVLVVGQKDKCEVVKRVCEEGLRYIETPNLVCALDVVSSAQIVIGVDTGLSHLAVNQGIPTIMLFRFNSIFQRKFDHVISLTAPECLSQCLIRELEGDFNLHLNFRDPERFNLGSFWETWHCAEEKEDLRCMSKIQVSDVARAALRLLDRVVKPLH